MGDRPTRVSHKEVKQFELFWGQVNRPSLFLNEMSRDINANIPDHDERAALILYPVTPNCGAKTCNEFAKLKWLCDVIICACIKSFNLAIFAPLHRQHHDGKTRHTFAHQPAHLDPSNARHIDVEQHHIELRGANEGQCFLSSGRFYDDIAQP